MWLFTSYGMYSAVCARQGTGKKGEPIDTERMMVRARDRDHLENLKLLFPDELQDVEIVESKYNDYRFRLFVDKKVWALLVATLVMCEDYDNFKGSIDRTLPKEQAGPYHGTCTRVWGVLYDHQRAKYGPGIYDTPAKTRYDAPLLADLERSPFNETETTESGELMRNEPDDDEAQVILVRDSETANLVGVIAFAEDIDDVDQAYEDAVNDGVIPRIAYPEFERDKWGTVKEMAVPVW